MKALKQSITLIIRCALFFVFCGTLAAAQGQTTYTYTGQSYNPAMHECNGTYLPCTQLGVTGSITFPVPIPANFSGLVNPSSFFFTDGVITLSSGMGLGVSTFLISTDGDGNIVTWNIFLETVPTTDFCATFNTEALASFGDVISGQGGDASCFSSDLNSPEQEFGSGGNGSIGAWSGFPPVPNLQKVFAALNQLRQTVLSDPANAGLSTHQIADKMFSAIVDARGGFYGANNEFAFLQGLDVATLAAVDHFSQSYDVSTNNTLFENAATGFIVGAVIDPVYNIGKAITQSFGVDFLDAGTGPQSPANFDFWALAGALAAIQEEPPGAVPDAGTDAVPIEPVSRTPDSSVFALPVLSSNPVTLDPARAQNYHLQVLYGAPITSVMIPRAALVFNRLKLKYGDTTVDLSPGVVYTFPTAVSDFALLDVTGPSFVPFLAKLSFATDGVEVVAQTAVSGLPVRFESSFDSVALDSTGANHVISFRTTNTGCDTARLVSITGIEVDGIPTSTVLPITVGTLISRATMKTDALIPVRSREIIDGARLKVTLHFSSGTESTEFIVLRPHGLFPSGPPFRASCKPLFFCGQ